MINRQSQLNMIIRSFAAINDMQPPKIKFATSELQNGLSKAYLRITINNEIIIQNSISYKPSEKELALIHLYDKIIMELCHAGISNIMQINHQLGK